MSLRSLVEDSFSENDSSDESFILTKENAELSDKNLNDESSSDDSGSDREGDNENPDEKSTNEAENEYLNESDRTKKREAKCKISIQSILGFIFIYFLVR
ncbi:hypothetical protein AX774_g2895 [Zancudomyces culisetae]|uniref:Uncharacterized protein n=1 Tax=Zancudomyces culisetae TaxID=1213189 RepID=A0A1R1PRS4_ZANCU|nr:hypothetical protein AX774_g2895 [Zancudomyces culisetae]|eukprot:OMH83592.1 hypothetical protein AX774_g2895 [Zancudomyces culisetae]